MRVANRINVVIGSPWYVHLLNNNYSNGSMPLLNTVGNTTTTTNLLDGQVGNTEWPDLSDAEKEIIGGETLSSSARGAC